MIHFKNIRWKNFLSTGNAWTEIQFDKSPSTLIVGENGSGKSTMLDALTFALFTPYFGHDIDLIASKTCVYILSSYPHQT